MTARNGCTVSTFPARDSSPCVFGGPARTPETTCTPEAGRHAAPSARRCRRPERTCPAAPRTCAPIRATGLAHFHEGAVVTVSPAAWSTPPAPERRRTSTPPGGMRGNTDPAPHASYRLTPLTVDVPAAVSTVHASSAARSAFRAAYCPLPSWMRGRGTGPCTRYTACESSSPVLGIRATVTATVPPVAVHGATAPPAPIGYPPS